MHRTIDSLVSASVSVNRAVFEANKSKADEEYLAHCAAEAIKELGEALEWLTRKGKRK
jgi:hypothetical protein